MTDLTNFYPKYPSIHDSYLNPYHGKEFNDVIVTKKEFAIEKLPLVEPLPDKPGELLRHQRYISRFMAADTGYDELLLFHEPGTGKTCTAVAVVEGMKATWIKGAIICAKGEGLNKNFMQELVFTCTDGRYIPNDYDELSELQRSYRLKRSIGEFYSFRTFETFAKELSELSDKQIATRYEDHVFVIDEVHNLREKDDADEKPDQIGTKKVNIYSQFFRLFHVLNRRKILLMSGTPIKDTPDEFASVMNLILPTELLFLSDASHFVNRYFNGNGHLRRKHRDELANKIKGRISYLSSATSEVKKVFIGTTIGNLKHFIVAATSMSRFQTMAYAAAYRNDEITRSIYTLSRQAALFVYPDSSVGVSGFNRYIMLRRNKRYEASREFLSSIDTLDKLRNLSSKYAQVVETLLNKPRNKTFIFCQFVNGSGSIVLAKILERYGFSSATGSERTKGRRYALCTNQTSTNSSIQRMVNRFNQEDNIDGEYIAVVIGSRVLNEGYTLKNVRTEFILTPHWNYAETAQAIARGWRAGSHNSLIERGDVNITVEVYQCVSLPDPSEDVPSIDLEMYETAERKDVINRQIERLVKETAFDCPLTIERNKVTGYDDERECDYQQCEYTCSGSIGMPLDTSTYNLLPSEHIKLKNMVIDKLKKSLRIKSEYSLDKLRRHFPQSDNFSLTSVLCEIIDSDELFYDRFGFVNFLRVAGTTLFLSATPKISGGMFNRYYSQNLTLENGDSFDTILNETYESVLPDKISQLFEYPSLTRKLLMDLPRIVQREILYGCILARDLNTGKNVKVRDDILSFYSGFYSRQNVHDKGETWVVALYADIIGTTCLYQNKFVECDIKHAQRVGMKQSPIGWYGLYNPALNDFCIRNDEVNRDKDLRKLTVGRRCVNYDQNLLVEIVARRMMIPYPADYLRGAARSGLVEAILQNKSSIPSDVEEDDDTIKRILYWSSLKKVDICNAMQAWFKDKGLMETNFDCGTQKKSRAKFR